MQVEEPLDCFNRKGFLRAGSPPAVVQADPTKGLFPGDCIILLNGALSEGIALGRFLTKGKERRGEMKCFS